MVLVIITLLTRVSNPRRYAGTGGGGGVGGTGSEFRTLVGMLEPVRMLMQGLKIYEFRTLVGMLERAT